MSLSSQFAPGELRSILIAWIILSIAISIGFIERLFTGNMIPIPPLDGYKIFKSNILVGLAIALPLWEMFLIFFMNL